MDEGLIFWLIIFAIAILQGIGQRKKKGGRSAGKPADRSRPSPPTREPARGSDETAMSSSTTRVPSSSTRTSQGSRSGGEGKKSSEELIPSEVWEEILGLARGKPSRPEPEPAPEPELRPISLEEETAPEEPPAEPSWGVTSREEAPSEESGVLEKPLAEVKAVPESLRAVQPSLVRSQEPRGSRVREGLFGDGSPEELRKAIVLREVLGPPVSLRGEPGRLASLKEE